MNLIAAGAKAGLTPAKRVRLLLLLILCFQVLSLKQAQAASSPIRVPRDFTTIQAAIKAAQPGQEIWVNQGTYPEQLTMKSQIGVYGGFTGSETQLGQRDPKAHPTILKPTINTNAAANDLKAGKIVTMDSLTSATLDGFTITIAPTTLHYGNIINIYAIYTHALDASNSIANCALTNMQVTCAESYLATLNLLYFSDASPYIRNCVIESNVTDKSFLFGAQLTGASAPVFIGCRWGKLVSANWESYVVYNGSYGTGGTSNSIPIFETCEFYNNNETSLFRSGLVKHCKFTHNTADALTIAGSVRVQDTLISNNTMGVSMSSGDATFTNCLITGNSQGWAGAFDLIVDNDLKLNILNCTIADNQGSEASAIALDHVWDQPPIAVDLRVINTLFTGKNGLAIMLNKNIAMAGEITNCVFDGFPKGVYYDDQIGTMATAGLMNRMSTWAHNNIQGVVRFVNAADGNYHLSNGSIALDRGRLADAPVTDYDGQVRPGADGKVDIGAFEATPAFSPTDPSLPPGSYVTPLPLASTLSTVPLSFVAWNNDGDLGHVNSVALYYRKNGGAWRQYGSSYSPSTTVTTSITFDSRLAAADGYYEFYTLATDGEGRREAPPSTPDAHIVIDTAHARTRVYVKPDATGLLSGTDWTNGVRNLSDGITMARALNVKEIWVARGNYSQSMEMWDDLKIYGGFAGNETSIAMRHITDNPTTITFTNSSVIWAQRTRNNVIDGFILACNNTGSTYKSIAAGNITGTLQIANCQFPKRDGVSLALGTFQLTNCTFKNNNISVTSATLMLDGCTFGGGRGIKGVASTLALSNSTFSGMAGPGGALSCDACNVRMTGCAIQHCCVGMGLAAAESVTAAPMTKEHLFWPQPLPSPLGAGILATKSKLRLENCLLFDNRAGYQYSFSPFPDNPLGGAIFITQESSLDCFNCTFVNNRIYPKIVFIGEHFYGGAIYSSPDSTLNLYNTIFSGNNYNAIFATNLNLNYCLFYNNPDGDTTGTVSRAVGVVKGDPMFVNPAAANFRLQASSPAIDAGMKVWSPIVDRDGQPRGVKGTTASRGDGANYDIGAYEYQPAPPIVSVIYPDGGEKLRAGTAFTVAWWANGRSAGKSVQLELWKAKTKVATLGTASNALGYGTVSFTLSGTLAGSDFRIRAQSLTQSSLVDWSDKPFTILAKNGVPAAHWLGYE